MATHNPCTFSWFQKTFFHLLHILLPCLHFYLSPFALRFLRVLLLLVFCLYIYICMCECGAPARQYFVLQKVHQFPFGGAWQTWLHSLFNLEDFHTALSIYELKTERKYMVVSFWLKMRISLIKKITFFHQQLLILFKRNIYKHKKLDYPAIRMSLKATRNFSNNLKQQQ